MCPCLTLSFHDKRGGWRTEQLHYHRQIGRIFPAETTVVEVVTASETQKNWVRLLLARHTRCWRLILTLGGNKNWV